MYQKIKQWILSANALHVFLSFMLSVMIAGLFKRVGTADPWVMIIVAPVIAFFIGVFGEVIDEWTEGNEFSHVDVLRDIVGSVLAMITLALLLL